MPPSASSGAKARPRKKPTARSSRTAPRPSSAAATNAFRLISSVSLPQLTDADGKSDTSFRQFLYDFSALNVSLETARAYLASTLGLTAPQYNIAMVIASRQLSGGIRVSDVAHRLHVSTAFITAEINKLESADLIGKKPNPADGRGVLLYLTRKGEQLVQGIGPERQRINDHLFGRLTAKEFQQLSTVLSSLLDDFAFTVRVLKASRMDNLPDEKILFEPERKSNPKEKP